MQIKSPKLILSIAIITAITLTFCIVFTNMPKDDSKDPYIMPEAMLFQNGLAYLNLKTALGFKLDDGNYGFIYFIDAQRNSATYLMSVYQKSGDSIRLLKRERGNVFMKKDKQFIYYGDKRESLFIWFEPCSLCAAGYITQFAAIPISEVNKFSEGRIDDIKWVPIVNQCMH